jgi:hypothetical protein
MRFVVRRVLPLALCAIALGGMGQRSSIPQQGEKLYPGLAKDIPAITRVEVKTYETTITLKQEKDGWVAQEAKNYPVNSGVLRKLLLDLADTTIVESKTSLADNYAALELQDVTDKGSKATLLTLKDKDGKIKASILLGKVSTATSSLTGGVQRFVRRAGETQTYLVSKAPTLPPTPVDWLQRDIVNVAARRIERLTLKGEGDASMVLERKTPFEEKLLPVQADGEAAKKDDSTDALADMFSLIAFEDARLRKDLGAEFKESGTVTAQTFDGLELTATVFRGKPADADQKFSQGTQTWIAFAPKPYKARSLDEWTKADKDKSGDKKDKKAPARLLPADILKADDAKAEQARLARLTDGWVFRLPDGLSSRFVLKLEPVAEQKPDTPDTK